jgi:hypothetical protein
MKRSLFVDAVIFATLTGLCLSSVLGCASVTPATLAHSMQKEFRQKTEPAKASPSEGFSATLD